MKIKWLGHSSFVLTESTGVSVLTDPFDPSYVGYEFNPPQVDLVTVSHGHRDHNFTKGVKYKKLITTAGQFEYNGIHILGVQSCHDGEGGRQRGKSIIYKFRMDGVNVCHMGDIGEQCSPELVERLMPVNVLLLPVGGNYTVDAEQAKEFVDRLMPGIVIPMHYKLKHCELDIEKEDAFLRLFDDECVQEGVSELDLDRNDFTENDATKVITFSKE